MRWCSRIRHPEAGDIIPHSAVSLTPGVRGFYSLMVPGSLEVVAASTVMPRLLQRLAPNLGR
jgi:hypothetical protein